MIKVLLIDDEVHNITSLNYLLQHHFESELAVVATALDADEGIKMIRYHQPDLVFLDIQMPRKTGFDLLRELDNYKFELIFVTAFDQYGIQAVKFSAMDYLLKPIDVVELKASVEKAKSRIYAKITNLELRNLVETLSGKADKADHKLALSTLKETRFVQVSEIIRCESENSYTCFYLENKEKILVSVPILEYEEMLSPYGLIRCHQSHLVNKKFIKSLVKDDGLHLLLKDGTKLPVSRLKKDMVRSAILSQ